MTMLILPFSLGCLKTDSRSGSLNFDFRLLCSRLLPNKPLFSLQLNCRRKSWNCKLLKNNGPVMRFFFRPPKPPITSVVQGPPPVSSPCPPVTCGSQCQSPWPTGCPQPTYGGGDSGPPIAASFGGGNAPPVGPSMGFKSPSIQMAFGGGASAPSVPSGGSGGY